MNKILSLALLMVFFISAKAQNKFLVEGKINNYNGKVYLIYGKDKDSAYTKHGMFQFKGKTKFPIICFITVPTEMDKLGITTFWVDGGKTLLELDTASFKNSRFEGLNVKGKVIESGKTNKLIDSITSEIIKINAQTISENEKNKKSRAIIDDLLTKYPNKIISTYFLSTKLALYDKEELTAIYVALNSFNKNSTYGLAIKNRYLKKVEILLGEKMPEFAQQNQFGKLVSVSDFKGKYLLIDFWASWCKPCRDENPNIVRAYQKFKDEGFDILAVSLDDDKKSWIKAIKNDNLQWNHVSDLGGWENEVSRMLKISAVPSNILVDKNGIVIAKNLRGEELLNKLGEIFEADR